MPCSPLDTIGRALLAGTLRVADLDFPTDQVTCLSVVLISNAPAGPACVMYRDGAQTGAKASKPAGRIAGITPLFQTAAGEPFTCRDLRDIAGLAARLHELVDERVPSDPGPPHYHLHEHWMGAHAELEPSSHATLRLARTQASARAESYRAMDYEVEGNPLVGYVISRRTDICVIQVVTCHGLTCVPAVREIPPAGPPGT
jgi:hypothetical protein